MRQTIYFYDYQKFANEDEVREAIRAGSPQLGLHSMPYCTDMSAMNDEGMQQKMIEGPVAFVTIFPNGMPNMGKYLVQQIRPVRLSNRTTWLQVLSLPE